MLNVLCTRALKQHVSIKTESQFEWVYIDVCISEWDDLTSVIALWEACQEIDM